MNNDFFTMGSDPIVSISDSNIINASLSKWCDSFDDMLIRESQVNGQ